MRRRAEGSDVDYTEADLTELFERSKDDRAMFAGSEIRALVSMARRALPSSSTAPRADPCPEVYRGFMDPAVSERCELAAHDRYAYTRSDGKAVWRVAHTSPHAIKHDGASTYRAEVVGKSPRGKDVVVARIPTPNRSSEQCEANAALFAAAPEMAKALRDGYGELMDLLTGKCEGGHPDIDDQTRRDLQSIADSLWAAYAKTGGA
jgi:hypothetical protein